MNFINLKNDVLKAMLIFIIAGLLCSCSLPESPKLKKYTAVISNWVGHESYDCDYYKKDGNTYLLFDKDSTLIREITLTEGYIITINKNF